MCWGVLVLLLRGSGGVLVGLALCVFPVYSHECWFAPKLLALSRNGKTSFFPGK